MANQAVLTKPSRRNSSKKKPATAAPSESKIKSFVRDFYDRYGKLMTKLSHE